MPGQTNATSARQGEGKWSSEYVVEVSKKNSKATQHNIETSKGARMLRSQAIQLGWAELQRHGLDEKGWTFTIEDRPVRRRGECKFNTKQIKVTGWHVDSSPDDEVIDTIRHEAAHAIAGLDAAHGPEWVAACIVTGADPCTVEGSSTVSLYQSMRRSRR